jgi:hypothetical protein
VADQERVMSLASLLEQVQAGAPVKPITQAIARWDGQLTVEAVERVHQLKLTDMNGDRSDGTGRLRGSLLGSCPRMQIMSYRGYLGADPDEVGADLMKDGTYRHYLWQEVGLSSGFLADIETKVKIPKWLFGGQLDGLMAPCDLPGKGGFELKVTKWDYYKLVKASGAPLHKHEMQYGAYMMALDLDWFSVVYELRSNRIEWQEFVVHNTPDLRRRVEANFGSLLGFIDREELPQVKPDYPKDKECAYWCGYTAICPSAEW